MDRVFLLTAHWMTGRGNEPTAPSYGLLDRTVYGRQEFAWSAGAPSAEALGKSVAPWTKDRTTGRKQRVYSLAGTITLKELYRLSPSFREACTGEDL